MGEIMTVAVSVILPTYNRAASLADACRSVLDQSFRDLELIVVDDASTEDIENVVKDLNDDRLVYVRRAQNGGASAARNMGLRRAQGNLIAFHDSDDLWLPGKLQRHVDLMNTLQDDVGAVIGTKILYGRDERRRYGEGKVVCSPGPEGRLSLEEDQVRRFLIGNRISLQNCLFRRTCMPEGDWFDARAKANADWEFSARLAQHTKIYEDYMPVVVAFISEDSVSKNPRKKALGVLRILRKNRAVYARYPDAKASTLLQLSALMSQCGRPGLAGKLVLEAMRTYPGIAPSALRPLKKMAQEHIRKLTSVRSASSTATATVKP